jgi:hypothetical protein
MTDDKIDDNPLHTDENILGWEIIDGKPVAFWEDNRPLSSFVTAFEARLPVESITMAHPPQKVIQKPPLKIP